MCTTTTNKSQSLVLKLFSQLHIFVLQPEYTIDVILKINVNVLNLFFVAKLLILYIYCKKINMYLTVTAPSLSKQTNVDCIFSIIDILIKNG